MSFFRIVLAAAIAGAMLLTAEAAANSDSVYSWPLEQLNPLYGNIAPDTINVMQWRLADGGNDHYYAVLDGCMHWLDAIEIAQTFAIAGRPGYLATITSLEENTFIFDSVIAGSSTPCILDQFWLGGLELDGNWTWITGEPFTFINWSSGEPNNSGFETALGMWGPTTTHPDRVPSQWNDAFTNTCPNPHSAFWSVIEWGDPEPSVPVRVCGNGVVDPGEQCDDGNTVSGDGCSPCCVDSLYQDLAIKVAALNSAVPGKSTMYGIEVKNVGDVPFGGEVILSLPPETDYILSDPPGTYIFTSHEVLWTLSPIDPQATTWFRVAAEIQLGVAPGTEIGGTAQIRSTPNDDVALDNVDMFQQTVTTSSIPNKKSVTPIGLGAEGLISVLERLHYQISFQNVGDDTAYSVVVRDTISPNLDLASLVIGTGSHANVLTTNGPELVWTIDNIDLPTSADNKPASHGFVTFSILPNSAVPPLSQIENYAAITFDSNPPVYTDTVLNTIDSMCLVLQTGDVNGSGAITSADIIFLVNYLFKSGQSPTPCEAVGDVNCSGAVTAADIIYTVNVVFLRGNWPCDVCEVIPAIWSCP